MMKKTIVILAAFALIADSSFAQKNKTTIKKAEPKPVAVKKVAAPVIPAGFSVTESGLQYMIAKDMPGTNAKVGDYLEMHISTKAGDSMLFDSRTMNNNQPVPYQVQPPHFKGDLAEGFLMLSAGDSALFRISVDSVLKTGAQLLPWMEKDKGMMIEYDVTIVSVKTPEQMKEEAEAKAAAQKGADDKLIQDYLKENKIQATKTASGLYYKITKKGAGVMPAAGDSVSMNYTGMLMTKDTFDSNISPKFQHVEPFWFTLGQHHVISGWDEGIALLPKGSKAMLYIPSGLAYGSQSPGKMIPPNSVLIFEVEVVDVKKAK